MKQVAIVNATGITMGSDGLYEDEPHLQILLRSHEIAGFDFAIHDPLMPNPKNHLVWGSFDRGSDGVVEARVCWTQCALASSEEKRQWIRLT